MKIKLQVARCQLQAFRRSRAARKTFNLQPATCNQPGAFSIIEVLVVITLLSLIVFALMAVFDTTQRAFRAGATQSDVLGGGREVTSMIASDLRQIAPSGGANGGPVNFFAMDNNYKPINNSYQYYPYLPLGYTPLVQNLPGEIGTPPGTPPPLRTNLLNYFFLLGRENTKWTGVGYVVNASSANPLYPLYRFYGETNTSVNPGVLFSDFTNEAYSGQWTNMSHVVDGVVHLVVRPNDVNGYPMTWYVQYESGLLVTNYNVSFYPVAAGETGFSFYSNTVPASVELDLGVLEDHALQRAESLPFQSLAQVHYLTNQVGAVHIFRQRVIIQNVDSTAYQ
ncbi:MAG TPA: hypothetical protein VIK53_13920 [Verrucomicrobiae bacterium]